MKKLLLILLVLTMVVSAFVTGCSKATESNEKQTGNNTNTGSSGEAAEESPVSPAGQFPIVEEPITLTIYREGTLTDEQAEAIESNGVLKYIYDKTNIKLELVHLNAAEGKQKMILSFAAGDYPDAAFLNWNTMLTRADIMQYGMKEQILMPLNDMIDEYGFEIKEIFELRPQHRAFISAPDGEIYGIPRFTECYHCMSYPKLWLNYTWMEDLGFEEPQTTDELYELLKAFKTQDPNGNGEADEIPLTGAIEWSCAIEYYLMNSFIYTDASFSSTNPRPFLAWMNDEVTFVADKPEYKAGLEWMKKLYDEGLIDPANFTQTAEGLSQQCRSEIPTVGGYTSDHIGMGIDFNDQEVNAMYHALPPVAGPEGVRYQPYTSTLSQIPGFNFAIFDTCSNPEAAFRLADWFLSEEMMPILHYGIEGICWEAPEDPNAKNISGGPLKWLPIRLPSDAPQEKIDEQSNNSLWMGLLGDLKERRDMWSPEATDETLLTSYETRLDWETKRTEEYWPEITVPRNLFMEEDIAEEFAEIKTNISTHVQKNTSMFITGARSLDEWDDYVKELNQFGLERYIEIYTQAYEDFQAKVN